MEKNIKELKDETVKLKNELSQKNCNCKKVKSEDKLKFSEAVKKNRTVNLKLKIRKIKLILKKN